MYFMHLHVVPNPYAVVFFYRNIFFGQYLFVCQFKLLLTNNLLLHWKKRGKV